MAVATKPVRAEGRLDRWLARKLADPKWRAKIKARSLAANAQMRSMGLLPDK